MGLINSGKLDRRVEILRRAAGDDDGYGQAPSAWTVADTRWASVKPRMGREAAEAAGSSGAAVMSFWFRFDEVTRAIDEACALRLDGRIYAILAPPIEVGRREGVEVIASTGGVAQ